jgi:Na+-translocating ferredoxin:NAD+ oxidoreductase RnfA subunit
VIYTGFIIATRKHLVKGHKKLDCYLLTTLILLGLSIIIIQIDTIYYIFTESIPDIVDILVRSYSSQLFEKLGIFVDIARLSIILI